MKSRRFYGHHTATRRPDLRRAGHVARLRDARHPQRVPVGEAKAEKDVREAEPRDGSAAGSLRARHFLRRCGPGAQSAFACSAMRAKVLAPEEEVRTARKKR